MTSQIVTQTTRRPVDATEMLTIRTLATIRRQNIDALPKVPGRLYELLNERTADAFECITSEAGIRVHRAAIEREAVTPTDANHRVRFFGLYNRGASGVIRAGVRAR